MDDSFPSSAPYADSERELLRAVRDLVAADRDWRRSLGQRMAIGDTDLHALRLVIRATREGGLTPRELAERLGISTASTTALLDRLAEAGHVERAPHPHDRRSKMVVPTEHAYEEARAELGAIHDRMRAAARAVPAEARPAVVEFLAAITELMREEQERS